MNPEIILGLLGRAARKGHLEAQYTLGLLAHGNILPRNYMMAIDWLKKAAYRGHARARYALAKIYLNGPISDDGRGIVWLEESAKGGYAEAQGELMNHYLLGRFVPKNYLQAYKWGILANSQGWVGQTDSIHSELAALEAQLPSSKIMEIQQEAFWLSRPAYNIERSLNLKDYEERSRQLLLPFERGSEESFVECY